MGYRVVMEHMVKPDDVPQWIWNQHFGSQSSDPRGGGDSYGGKGFVSKLSSTGSVWEYSGSYAFLSASAKAAELSGSDSTGRIYKVIEIWDEPFGRINS